MRRPFTPRTILLRSPDGRDFVRLTAQRTDTGYPSVELRAEATAKGFSGGADVWIDGFALKQFVAALRALEKSGQGHVELPGIAADEFRVVVRKADGAGHLLAEFAVARRVRAGDGPEDALLRVSGAFELDPTTLGEVVGGFAALAKALAA